MPRPYYNTNGFKVIQDDDRDPYVSWKHHRARGSAGGVDLVAPYGTPLNPPSRVYVVNIPWDGTGGNTVRMYELDDRDQLTGPYDEYLHCSEFKWKTNTIADPTDIVALSGASGNGDLHKYAPHLHWHRYVGRNRVNPWDYFRLPTPALPQPGKIPLNEGGLTVAEADRIIEWLEANVRGTAQHPDSLFNKVDALSRKVEEEGREARVYFNKASGVYAVGGLNYWWELGANINVGDQATTWAAREQFGRDTLGSYRRAGLAQDYVFRLEEEEWNFFRMLCLNSGATTESRLLEALSVQAITDAISNTLSNVEIKGDFDISAIAKGVANELQARLTA